jgi:hypothetical protein
VVSTGTMVWELVVTGQVFDQKWSSIGLRWKKPNLLDEITPISKLGGLEMYVNSNNVGRTLLPAIENIEGKTVFKPLSAKIDGKNPPVITLGCAWNYEEGKLDYHSGGEYDELAMWTRQLVKNNTLNELPFMNGGYCKLKTTTFLPLTQLRASGIGMTFLNPAPPQLICHLVLFHTGAHWAAYNTDDFFCFM